MKARCLFLVQCLLEDAIACLATELDFSFGPMEVDLPQMFLLRWTILPWRWRWRVLVISSYSGLVVCRILSNKGDPIPLEVCLKLVSYH